MNSIKLIDIKSDEGYSGSTLDRRGLQAALQMIRRGRAHTLLVAKLDRLARSLRDVCSLIDEMFSDERYHLLSLCGMANTHSAAGRMVLLNLANYNQYERELISERTRDALQHMKAQGVRLGPAPYGYELSHECDEHARRKLVPLAHEQQVLSQIESMREMHPKGASGHCRVPHRGCHRGWTNLQTYSLHWSALAQAANLHLTNSLAHERISFGGTKFSRFGMQTRVSPPPPNGACGAGA